jgi:hypothetical protein
MTGPTADTPTWDEADAAPMPPETPPDTCPHCATAWRSKGTVAKLEDAAVCQHCLNLLIREAAGWRSATYDEAELWDRDPRIIAMRRIWAKPLPEPDDPPQ